MNQIHLDQAKTAQQRPKTLARVETPGGGYAELSYRFDAKYVPHGTFEVILAHKHERAAKPTKNVFLIEKNALVDFDLKLQTLIGRTISAIVNVHGVAETEDGDTHELVIKNRRIPLA